MTPAPNAACQASLEEAANAFMKVMALRGFSVRDYPQNFVAHLTQQTRLHFETAASGPHPQADALVSGFLRAGAAQVQPVRNGRRNTARLSMAVLQQRSA
jgi:hypothetical protein